MTGIPEPAEDQAVDAVVDTLAAQHPMVDRSWIESTCRSVYDRIAEESKAPAFLGILTEREVRRAIEQLGSE